MRGVLTCRSRGILKKVPCLALILQLYCLPGLRTQEEGAHLGRGETLVEDDLQKRMRSGLQSLMVCRERADVFRKPADVAF